MIFVKPNELVAISTQIYSIVRIALSFRRRFNYHICFVIRSFTTGHSSTFNHIEREFFRPVDSLFIQTNLTLRFIRKKKIVWIYSNQGYFFIRITLVSLRTDHKCLIGISKLHPLISNLYEQQSSKITRQSKPPT